jgi:ADP-heptose:LPS heptosyltransferase
MMSPVSRRVTRAWSLEGYAKVAAGLARRAGARVFCLWGPGEREQAAQAAAAASDPRVALAPEFGDLASLAAYLSHASCLVTNCNGTRHMAVALGVPTLTLHMSSDPKAWNPPNPEGAGFHPRHPVLRAENLFCIGCKLNQCPYNLECAQLLDASEVLKNALQLLNRTGGTGALSPSPDLGSH